TPGCRAPSLILHWNLPPALRPGSQRPARVLDMDGTVRGDLAGIPEVALLLIKKRPAAGDQYAIAGLSYPARIRIPRLQPPTQPWARDVPSQRPRKAFAAEGGQ